MVAAGLAAFALGCPGLVGDAAAAGGGQPLSAAMAWGAAAPGGDAAIHGISFRVRPGRDQAWLPRHLVAAEQASLAEDEQADLPPGAKVTREQAIEIALKVVQGEATSVEVERKLGKLVFTVEIMTPAGEETDVFVDVFTGEVVGTE